MDPNLQYLTAPMLIVFVPFKPWAWLAVVLALVLTPPGIALICFVRRRKFYRRNVAGIEEFKSYGSAVVTRLGEGVAGLVGSLLAAGGISAAIIAVGAFLAAAHPLLNQ